MNFQQEIQVNFSTKAELKNREYWVSTETFREQAHQFPRISVAVDQLIRRFDIRDKKILSLGPRFGREEYWFAKNGNQITMVDIDEQGDLEPALSAAESGPLRYLIGDALNAVPNEPFDVLFLSGFGPDEFRRREITVWKDPFHPVVMRYAQLCGLTLIQSFYGGPDLDYHPDMLPACDDQLMRHRLKLYEVYRLKVNKGCHLFVIGSEPPLRLECEITLFHGRGADEPVARVR
jgi:hypothetical protein